MNLKLCIGALLSILVLSTACSSKPKEEAAAPVMEFTQPPEDPTYTAPAPVVEEPKAAPTTKKKKSKKVTKKSSKK